MGRAARRLRRSADSPSLHASRAWLISLKIYQINVDCDDAGAVVVLLAWAYLALLWPVSALAHLRGPQRAAAANSYASFARFPGLLTAIYHYLGEGPCLGTPGAEELQVTSAGVIGLVC